MLTIRRLAPMLVGLVGLALVSMGAGCSVSSSDATEQGSAAVSGPRFSGIYKPASKDAADDVSDVSIEQRGNKLYLQVDQWGEVLGGPDGFELTKTKTGSYTMNESVHDECDDPGCGYLTNIEAVVFLKKVGDRKVPHVKLILTSQWDHPEQQGDLEGEHTVTALWSYEAPPPPPVVAGQEPIVTTLEGYYASGATRDAILPVEGLTISKEAGDKYVVHVRTTSGVHDAALVLKKPGLYTFDSGPIAGSCSGPGCSFVSRIAGGAYLQTDSEGEERRHAIKLNTYETFLNPEFEGDLQGEFPSTTRWAH